MSLELKIVSKHADIVGDDFSREFSDDGGSIGRSLQNDWILPDPDRYISGRHATIDFKGGIYYLLDTSSNGVYFNNEMEPVGKGNTRRLFNGDRLRMGDFEFQVALEAGESLVMPLDDDDDKRPADNNEQLVDEVSLRTGIKLLDEEEIAGDNVFESALFSGNPETGKAEVEAIAAEEAKISNPVREVGDASQSSGKVTSGKSRDKASSDSLFNALLDGLNIERAELHPDIDREAMMLSAGQVLRETVQGLCALIAGRAELKNTFRLEQTTILPRYNNPLKLSDNTNDLLKQLLVGSEGDYLAGEDAIRETCRDLVHHQNAFLDAMNAAFVDFADQFDPADLETSVNASSSPSRLLPFLNGKRYWEAYCDLYPILTEKGSGRFPSMFGEEFVSAYERQVAEYQRLDREGSNTASSRSLASSTATLEPGLLATQKLENPAGVAQEMVATTTSDDASNLDSSGDDNDLVAAIESGGAVEIDQNFLDELDNHMASNDSKDQLNG